MVVTRRGSRAPVKPMLGVITCRRRLKVSAVRPFGNQSFRFKGLCTGARRLGLRAYVFFAEDVNLDSGRIKGMTFSGKRKAWVTKSIRLPDAVYNRIPTRRHEAKGSVRSALEAIEEKGIPLFNTRYLYKLEVYKATKNLPTIAPHFPETRRLRGVKDLEAMLAKHGTVYLKRNDGTLGNGIGVITVTPQGIVLRRTRANRKVQTKRLSRQQLSAVVARYLRLGRYLVQQGLDLVTCQGRPIDFRVMVQKRGDGRWRLTGAATRVAGPKQITTHVPRGGSRLSFTQGIMCATGADAKRTKAIAADIRKLCCATARRVERTLGLHLAEASFDVGVDVHGRIWIIEMNSKPFLFDEKDIQTKARRYLLDYARHVIEQRRNSQTAAEV